MTNLSSFGKAIRKIRVDKDIMLKTMADKLDVSASYLSAVERGNKAVNANFLNKTIEFLELNNDEANQLTKLASELDYDITIKPKNSREKELALMLARKMDNDSLDLSKLEDFLNTV